MLDRALAALLTVGAQLEIWLSSEVTHHQLQFALVAPLVTAPIAVRRRYPTRVGTAVPVRCRVGARANGGSRCKPRAKRKRAQSAAVRDRHSRRDAARPPCHR